MILSSFVAFTTPTLSISLSLTVSPTWLHSFNVISLLSPSHVPSSPPFYFRCCFASVCLLCKFHFHLTFLFFQLHLSLSFKSILFCSHFLSSPLFYLASISLFLSLLLLAVGPHSPIPTLDWSQPLPPLMRGDWVLNWALQSQLGHTDWGYGLLEASRVHGVLGQPKYTLITCPSNSKWLFNDTVRWVHPNTRANTCMT